MNTENCRGLWTVSGLVVMLLVTVGCTVEPAPKLESPRFDQLGTVALDAASVVVVDEYRPPMAKPNVDHLAPTPPNQAVRRWVGDHFRAVGGSGTIQVIIRDASIVETPLPLSEGVAAVFTTDQSHRYDGRIEVRIVGQSPRANFSGYVQATATRSTSVAENISLAGREETWNNLVRQMIIDLSTQLDRGLRESLQPMLSRR